MDELDDPDEALNRIDDVLEALTVPAEADPASDPVPTGAAANLRLVAEADPGAVSGHLDAVDERLGYELERTTDHLSGDPDAEGYGESVRTQAELVRAMARVARDDPDAVVPYTGTILAADAAGPEVEYLSAATVTYLGLLRPDETAEHTSLTSMSVVSEHAGSVQSVAEDHPREVASYADDLLATLAAALDSDGMQARDAKDACSEAVRAAARGAPDEFGPHAEGLVTTIDADNPEDVNEALAEAVMSVARADPDGLAVHADALLSLLSDDGVDGVDDPLAKAIGPVAESDPDAVAGRTGSLVDALEAQQEGFESYGTGGDPDEPSPSEALAAALEAVARDHPAAVGDHADDLAALLPDLDDEALSVYGGLLESIADDGPEAIATAAVDVAEADGTCASALAVLADDDPGLLVPGIDHLVSAVDASYLDGLEDACASTLRSIAADDPGAVAAHTGAIVTASAPDFVEEAREECVATISTVGEDHPGEVGAAVVEVAEADERCASALRTVANDAPGALAGQIDRFVAALGADDLAGTNEACATALRSVADERPDALPTGELLTDGGADSLATATEAVAVALAELARERPEAVATESGAILAALEGIEYDDVTHDCREALESIEAGFRGDMEALDDPDEALDQVDEVVSVLAVDDGDAGASTPQNAARNFRIVAAADPRTASDHLALAHDRLQHELDRTDPDGDVDAAAVTAQYELLQAATLLAEDDPDAVVPHVETFASALEEPTGPAVRGAAAGALAAVADGRPGAVASHADAVAAAMATSSDPNVLERCGTTLGAVAEEDPDAVVPHVERLASVARETATGGVETPADDVVPAGDRPGEAGPDDAVAAAARTLETIGSRRSDALASHADALVTALGAAGSAEAGRACQEALQAVAADHPDAIPTDRLLTETVTTVNSMAERIEQLESQLADRGGSSLTLYRCRNSDCASVYAARRAGAVNRHSGCEACGESRLKEIGQVELVGQ